jgi:repressor LexA
MTNLGNKETFAKNLSYYIDKSGKTKKDIAEIVGVAPSTLNEWTKGKKYPRIDKIEILANYFRILKSDLIEEQTEKRRDIQKKNDALTDLVIRMRTDKQFFSLIEGLNNLNAVQLESVKQIVAAFQKQ